MGSDSEDTAAFTPRPTTATNPPLPSAAPDKELTVHDALGINGIRPHESFLRPRVAREGDFSREALHPTFNDSQARFHHPGAVLPYLELHPRRIGRLRGLLAPDATQIFGAVLLLVSDQPLAIERALQ